MQKNNQTKFKETEIGTIPEEWEVFSLTEIADVIGGGTPKTRESSYWNGNIPWLSVVDFNNDSRKVYTTEKFITDEGLKNSSTKVLKKGALVISARGTVGALTQLGVDMAFNQSCYGLVAKSISGDLLYYLVKNVVADIQKRTHGSVFDTITRETLDGIKLGLPANISEQKQIAEILSSLDDKIELNRQINANLEKIASSLFKHWFVDFEFPDQGSKPYKSSGGKMIDSELGEIPEGWKIGPIK
ncbi:restriction endonuclease subunit S, partial [Patescibacteria group bacterium]|nr:restriction endonuclease subunit S [Patescibacteria group bacterium]